MGLVPAVFYPISYAQLCCLLLLLLQFLAARQKSDRSAQFRGVDDCSSTSTCKLQEVKEKDGDSMPLYEACRLWSKDINRFGEQLDNLRALWDSGDDKGNSFSTTKSGVRIWPYRPRKTGTTQNLIMYGLQSQSFAKCKDCFDKEKAKLVEDALWRYG
jgi:hypothetical protein